MDQAIHEVVVVRNELQYLLMPRPARGGVPQLRGTGRGTGKPGKGADKGSGKGKKGGKDWSHSQPGLTVAGLKVGLFYMAWLRKGRTCAATSSLAVAREERIAGLSMFAACWMPMVACARVIMILLSTRKLRIEAKGNLCCRQRLHRHLSVRPLCRWSLILRLTLQGSPVMWQWNASRILFLMMFLVTSQALIPQSFSASRVDSSSDLASVVESLFAFAFGGTMAFISRCAATSHQL